MTPKQTAWHESGHAVYAMRQGIVPKILTIESGFRYELVPAGSQPGPEHRYDGMCDLGEFKFENTDIRLFQYMMAGPAAEELGADPGGYVAGENMYEIVEACTLYDAYEFYTLGIHSEDSLERRGRYREVMLRMKAEGKAQLREDPWLAELAGLLIKRKTLSREELQQFMTRQST